MDFPVIAEYNNTLFVTNPEGKEQLRKLNDRNGPKPFRMTMIRINDNCQFCPKPYGPSYCHSICHAERYGFISCHSCLKLAKQACQEWFDNEAYGGARFLKGKTFKVRRSSGTIEDGWTLDEFNPLVYHDESGELVFCVNRELGISRSCKVSELIELNK